MATDAKASSNQYSSYICFHQLTNWRVSVDTAMLSKILKLIELLNLFKLEQFNLYHKLTGNRFNFAAKAVKCLNSILPVV